MNIDTGMPMRNKMVNVSIFDVDMGISYNVLLDGIDIGYSDFTRGVILDVSTQFASGQMELNSHFVPITKQ